MMAPRPKTLNLKPLKFSSFQTEVRMLRRIITSSSLPSTG